VLDHEKGTNADGKGFPKRRGLTVGKKLRRGKDLAVYLKDGAMAGTPNADLGGGSSYGRPA